ncbi:MAG: hypothetical protein KDA89_15905 [Planctomycetaceae bacterium]|nr:hypothetical protein [Planctomycetaceae bacterium]
MLLIAAKFAVMDSAAAQSISVEQMMESESKWAAWSAAEDVLHLSGRFEGRLSNRLKLQKLSILVVPQRSAQPPDNLKLGQRLTVSGVLRRSGNSFLLQASRITIGTLDTDRLAAQLSQIPAENFANRYRVADEFDAIAAFYNDTELRREVAQARQNIFLAERQRDTGNPAALLKLAERGTELSIAAETLQAIRFQAVVEMSKAPQVDTNDVLSNIRRRLPDWDTPAKNDDTAAVAAFRRNPTAAYEAADADARHRMHRWFFRSLYVPVIMADLKPDGSNGPDVASRLLKEVPEETELISQTREQYLTYRLKQIPQLNRRQFEDLESLLREFQRESEIPGRVDEWLNAQTARLNNGQLDGLLATGEEYLYAWERWKRPEHRQRGTDLLKQAWLMAREAAPKEAAVIAQRLEQNGWTRLRDRWMTTEDVAALPPDNVDLAMREGRVVAGMKPAQIIATLGEPKRRIRVVSSRQIQEVWLYGDTVEASGIIVHLERGRHESADKAVATRVSRSR